MWINMKIKRKGVRKSLENRFWNKVIKRENCWVWDGARDGCGYGMLATYPSGYVKAHRFSYRLHFGPFLNSLQVLHKCDNTFCVNPQHLFLGTRSDNQKDSFSKGRNSNKGLKNPNRRLNEQTIAAIRSEYYKGGIKQIELASRHGISQSYVSAIILNKAWS